MTQLFRSRYSLHYTQLHGV